MDLMQGLQALMGQGGMGGQQAGFGGAPSRQSGAADMSGLGGLGELLNPATLSGLLGALFPSQGGRSGAQSGAVAGSGGMGGGLGGLGALLGGAGAGNLGALGGLLSSFLGGGSPALGQHQEAMDQAVPQYAAAAPAASPRDRVTRMVRAIIYAAKSDGRIDGDEQRAIGAQFQKLDLGPDSQALIQQAMTEPLDPQAVARGVQSSDEALQLYALSCVIAHVDTSAERRYLDALGQALRIPDNVKRSLEAQLGVGA